MVKGDTIKEFLYGQPLGTPVAFKYKGDNAWRVGRIDSDDDRYPDEERYLSVGDMEFVLDDIADISSTVPKHTANRYFYWGDGNDE